MTRRFQSKLAVALSLCVLAVALAARAEKITDIHAGNYLTDLAHVIDAHAAERINAQCAELERKTAAQVGVVTVRSLEGRPIEDYAVDLYKHLGIGHKDNRGVLLLIAPTERRYRFEVGYGLEPIINDARAGDIGRAMVPLLRQNNYSAAAELGVQRAAALIAGESSRQRAPPAQEHSEFPFWAIVIVVFGVLSVLRTLSRFSRGSAGIRRRRGLGWWWMGPWGGWGGGGWGSGGGAWGGGFGGSSGGFGGFGGGSSGGGGASGSW